MIGRRKYEALLISQILSDSDLKDIAEYESVHTPKIQSKEVQEYFKRLKESDDVNNFMVNYEVLSQKFIDKFKELEFKEFDNGVDNVNFENLNTLLLYFSKDKEFFNCKNVSKLSNPSFEKGLLIIGSYGNGKTTCMRVFKELFNHTPLTFKMFTANKIVSTFEGFNDSVERNDFMTRIRKGDCYIDDVKTEKIASNYGKSNLIKEIIEERYSNKAKTYLTGNYKEFDSTNSLTIAIDEFNEKYGARVYDRIFEMFNIIEFKGKSLRK